MICFRCGHSAKDHYHYEGYNDGLTKTRPSFGCNTCRRYRTNKNFFFKHLVENNLEYLERRSKEKL